jgi:transposase InsO family protein
MISDTSVFLVAACNGTQFTSTRFLETLSRLSITHRRRANHHPEVNSIERFHRSLKEEEVWVREYRSMRRARRREDDTKELASVGDT